uniref:Uncharacterized protein n=1 Tax=Setaria viridis TaxID=4556 RepID=A0A4U6UYK8_SETVI|nr:hypothetical protein SEVIR_4G143401v2 [Setaria viridis]
MKRAGINIFFVVSITGSWQVAALREVGGVHAPRTAFTRIGMLGDCSFNYCLKGSGRTSGLIYGASNIK